ncbi:dynein axonemal assembly factor 11 [Stegastes partitus]|uniref:Leucine-rich repeat-containing protein 6 n=1 Tax=Stegastes partitus TaxID=144197 RepID=A0A9Y4N8F4_9TELE|nr:PREDICTED: protein tilB homolog [Stegastes partitus]
MVHITEDLIRRRAEHNDCEIFSLEEVSLHQQDIERIEHIDRWCRDLKILYLQNNLIPRIENLGHLKKLEYLNLALNNIEAIENLEGCENLQKLDLTVNFVGRLSTVDSLKHNIHLTELFLVGNPCTEFEGYRQYVVAALPQLKWLDGTEISRSERIRASQGLEEVMIRVGEQEEEYLRKRSKEKEEANRKAAGGEKGNKEKKPGFDGRWYTDINNTTPGLEENQDLEENLKNQESDEGRREREFWETPCSFTPESRLEAHRHLEQKRTAKKKQRYMPKPKTPRTLIAADGRVLNVNEPKYEYNSFLKVATSADLSSKQLYKAVESPSIFQMVLPAEVKPDSSTAQRSQTTGHLVLTLPLAEGEIKVAKISQRPARKCPNRPCSSPEDHKRNKNNLPERLEVDPSKRTSVDVANIVQRQRTKEGPLEVNWNNPPATTDHFSEDFVDDPDVPPLI